MVTIFCLVFWSFAITFLFCECGEKVMNEAKLCQLNWYEWPHELQRMLVIVMMDAQEPANIQGFANNVCSRELFKAVSAFFRVHLICNMNSLIFQCCICFSLNRLPMLDFHTSWRCDNSFNKLILFKKSGRKETRRGDVQNNNTRWCYLFES